MRRTHGTSPILPALGLLAAGCFSPNIDGDDGPTGPGPDTDADSGPEVDAGPGEEPPEDGGPGEEPADAGEPPAGGCSVEDTSGCVPGSSLHFSDETWTCDQPLSSYGALPLEVVLDFTNNDTDFGVRLGTGCTGDDDPSSIDLIVEVRGDGLTYGTSDDAVRIMNASPGATNIQITGHADCGKKQGDAHQDGIHAIGGTDITFVDFTIGDYDGGVATCMGAGGVVFYSGSGAVTPRNLHIVRGKYIGCNHALLNGNPPNPTGSAIDASFRSGRNFTNGGPAGICQDGDGRAYFTSPPCIILDGSFESSGLTCERWDPGSASWAPE